MEQKICPKCNTEFIGRENKVYCSIKCRNSYHNSENNANWYDIAKRYKQDLIERDVQIANLEQKLDQLESEYPTPAPELEAQVTELNNTLLEKNYEIIGLTRKVMDTEAVLKQYNQLAGGSVENLKEKLVQLTSLTNENQQMLLKYKELKRTVKKIENELRNKKLTLSKTIEQEQNLNVYKTLISGVFNSFNR